MHRHSCLFGFALVLTAATVLAMPTEAPSCVVGVANPQDLHLALARNPKTGEIQVGGFDVFLNDVKLAFTNTPANKTFEFGIEEDQKLTIKAENGNRFKGVLLLLSKDGTDAFTGLLPLDPLKAAPGCVGTPVAGVTHSERSVKTSANSTLRWDGEDGDVLLLDVNIVVQNNVTGSFYYYSQYRLKAVVPESPPVNCGLFGLGFFCRCGFFRKLLGLCK